MKRFILTIIVLCSASFLYAQSPCEKAYNEAIRLYKDGKYNEAKTKFQLIENDCDSNKEAAILGIELCDAKLNNKKLIDNNDKLTKENSNLMSENAELKTAKQNWLNSKKELEKERNYYQSSYNKYLGLYRIDSAEIVKLRNNITSLEIVAGNQEPTADSTGVCSKNDESNNEIKAVLKDIYNELNEYMEISGFKNWLNSKNLKSQADTIRKKIKPYIGISDTKQDVKPTEKPSEQIK